jgi:ATP-dependent Clp protease, protease subunit
MNARTRSQSPFGPRPPLEVWRDGPTMWNEWARAALLERRTVLIDRPLDEGMATQAAAELMVLESAGDDAIVLRVDAAGGTVGAALTLIDVLDLLGVPVHATCVGRAEGPVLAVLAVADHRSAAPHARLRWGDDADALDGSATDVARFAAQRLRELDQLVARVAAATRLDAGELREAFGRRSYVALDAAQEVGLIDEVLEPEGRVVRFPRRVGYERD